MKIVGIIYIHDITQVRGGDATYRNISMFRQAVGPENIQDVTVITTKWDQVTSKDGEKRFNKLKTDYNLFGTFGNKSVTMWKYKPQDIATIDYPLPLDIVKATVANGRDVLLNIQKEVIHERKRLDRIQAGVQLKQEAKDALTDTENEHKEKRRELKKRYKTSNSNGGNGSGPGLKSEMKELKASQKREVMEHKDRQVALKMKVVDSSGPLNKIPSWLYPPNFVFGATSRPNPPKP